MYKFMKKCLAKHAELLARTAFVLGEIHEVARSFIDNDLPTELQTRFRLKIRRYKNGELRIIWGCRDITNAKENTYYSPMWPGSSDGNYFIPLLGDIAQPSESTLVRRLEKCFTRIRKANLILEDMDRLAEKYSDLIAELSSDTRHLYGQYQDSLYGVDAEEILSGFNDAPNSSVSSSKHASENDA